jgi:hypothetical protein
VNALRFVIAGIAVAAGSVFAQGEPQPITAPHYGDTLFNFYQDKTFSALTGLMVSQHFGRIAPHDDEAEVLRGGMLLSYGLHREAGEVFARLIERQTTPAVRDRAWFFLAKVRHQRGLLAEAEDSLSRITNPLPGTLEEDRQLLAAQLLMARQDFAGAAAVLEKLKTSPTAGLYARFNLGVALIRTGDVKGGQALLDAVGQTPAPNEELRSLGDRANVALGFAALQAKQPREARVALQRVRLNAQQSNKALLGFGWAAAELSDPQLALAPWIELASRDSGDAAVLEARIAVPYAYGELGAYGQALRGYQEAASGFDAEGLRLTESIAAIRAGKLVQGLITHNPSEGLAAFKGIAELPEMPYASHLTPLLAGNDFQEGFKNLRDLQFLAGNLAQWQQSLGSFEDMLANRQRAFAERLPAVRQQAGRMDLAALQQRRDALAAELARVQQAQDAAAFATPRERELLQRVQRGQATLAQAGTTTPELAEAAERLRRAAGALAWQMSQDYSAREWEARKALRQADQALAATRERDAALRRAEADEPARQQAFAARIQALSQRIAALAPQVALLTTEQQGQLQDLAIAELQAQQERLAVYAAQARLAIAQIHDRAQFARRSDAPASRAGGTPEVPR